MFVGATGIGRVIQRTVELMVEHDTTDVRPFGGITAPVQRYVNFHFSVSLDLFGAETSTNAANYFAAGLKGRYHENRRDGDHRRPPRSISAHPAAGRSRTAGDHRCPRQRPWPPSTDLRARTPPTVKGGRPLEPHAGRGRRRGGAAAAPHGVSPGRRGVRRARVTPDGRVVPPEEWERRRGGWLPTADDKASSGR